MRRLQSGKVVAHQLSHPLRLPDSRRIGLELADVRFDVQHRSALDRVQCLYLQLQAIHLEQFADGNAQLVGPLFLPLGEDSDPWPVQVTRGWLAALTTLLSGTRSR